MERRSLLVFVLIAEIACTTARPPGTFADSGPFHGNTLTLKPDGTFTYEAWSDDGGAYWRGEGTWKWENTRRFVTEVSSVTLGSELARSPLDRHQVWQVTTGGVVRDTPIFKRKRGDP